MALRDNIKSIVGRLTPRQRQFAMLGSIMAVGVGALWAVFAFTDGKPKVAPGQSSNAPGQPTSITNIGIMPGGQQVNPIDQWVGNAGKKLAQYDADKQDQARINADRKAFEDNILKRFADYEQKQTSAAQSQAGAINMPPPPPVPTPAPAPGQYPPQAAVTAASGLPPPPPPSRNSQVNGMPSGAPAAYPAAAEPPVPALIRVSLGNAAKTPQASPAPGSSGDAANRQGDMQSGSTDTYLPVSFTRGELLGGLDAPTGGQSQSNPHPVLIRLSDNAVLPNRARSNVKECFVIAAGYGDISSERAYLRTESLSCVRNDNSTLEVKIQGSVYGEDGKVGLRGRLVTKQGQMLANALRAGIVGGIGQGFAQSGATVSTSTFGTVATTSDSTREQIERGIGSGVGRALDRLSQYYIKLAEQTFPIIEIDAGRQVDVVITKGVRIDAGTSAKARATSADARLPSSEDRYLRTITDEDY